jgi:hypothetical protein
MSAQSTSKPSAGQRVKHELRELLIICLYLFVCFSALLFLKYAILDEHGMSTWRFGLAIGKALILGKFILLGQAMHVGERHKGGSLARGVFVKSLLFLVVLIALSVVEEIIVSLVHHRPFSQGLAERGTPLKMFASSLVMLLILIPYFAFQELDEAMGDGKLKQMFFSKRESA